MVSKTACLLIVDDNPLNIHLLADILDSYNILFAINGEKALELALHEQPDLILLDIVMPNIDGYEVCKRLKANPITADIPVIFITAQSNDESEVYGFELGAVDYIGKPFRPEIIKARVCTQIELHCIEKEKRAAELKAVNQEKEQLVEELQLANLELAIQSNEKEKRTAELARSYDENELLNHQVIHMQKIESVSRLTFGIAHDFNNILTSILGYNELNKFAAEDIVDENLKTDMLNNALHVEKAGFRAVELIKKMMAYSRQNSIKSNNSFRATLDVIYEVLAMVRPGLTCKFQIDLDAEADLNIHIDAIDLHQILTNLLINARDAMKKGGLIMISLKAITISDALNCHCAACSEKISGEFIMLGVQDYGTGIEPDVLKRVFQPFFTTKQVGEGTGLGLSTVSGMVHHSNGHILVDSRTHEPNQGTSFKLLFPMENTIEIAPKI